MLRTRIKYAKPLLDGKVGRTEQVPDCLVQGKVGQVTHGKRDTKAYIVWQSMIQRCLNPNNESYHRYGGRGITICTRWRLFVNFYQDMIVVRGLTDIPEGLSLDRLDPRGHYSPENCDLVTLSQQNMNQRRTVRYPYEGKMLTIKEISDLTGLAYHCLYKRIRRMNWPIERVLSEPIHNTRSGVHFRLAKSA